MKREEEIIDHIYFRTIQFVFQQVDYDQRFIEVATEKGLSKYFRDLDLSNCNLKECLDNVHSVVKEISGLDLMFFVMYNNLMELYGMIIDLDVN